MFDDAYEKMLKIADDLSIEKLIQSNDFFNRAFLLNVCFNRKSDFYEKTINPPLANFSHFYFFKEKR